MKRTFIVTLLILSVIVLHGETINIADYFPVGNGYKWEYCTPKGEKFLTKECKVDKNGIYFYTIYDDTVTALQKLFIKDNTVFEEASSSIVTGVTVHDQPRVHISIPGKEWHYSWTSNDNIIIEAQLSKSGKSKFSYDNKIFNDCIVIETTVYLNEGKGLQYHSTQYDYYAKGIGHIANTLKSTSNPIEHIVMKLGFCSFRRIP